MKKHSLFFLAFAIFGAALVPITISAKVHAVAVEEHFKAFAGLNLPNEITVLGADPDAVSVYLIYGLGDITKIKDRWVWRFQPEQSGIGQVFTVTYKVVTEKGDSYTGIFDVATYSLLPVAKEMFYPNDEVEHQSITTIDNLDLNGLQAPPFQKPSQYQIGKSVMEMVPQPYIGVPFRINGKFVGLDGHYRIEILAEGKPYRQFDEPFAEFVPEFGKDERKNLLINIYYRSFQDDSYQLLRTYKATIQPPPLNIFSWERNVNVGEEVSFNLAYGIEGNYTMPASDMLNVESDGFYLPKGLRVWRDRKSGSISMLDGDPKYDDLLVGHPANADSTFTYILKPTEKYEQLAHDQTSISITIKDPITKQSVRKVIRLINGRVQ